MKNIYTSLFLIIITNCINAQNYEWLFAADGSNQGRDLESTIDNNNNIIFGGFFTSDTMFAGQDTLINEWAPNPAGFLIKKNSSGNVLWAKVLSSPTNLNFSNVSGIDTDNFRNVYVTGSFSGDNMHFGNNISVNCSDDVAFYVVKYNPSGMPIWAKTGSLNNTTTGEGAKGRSIVVDNLGNSYVGCDLRGGALIIDGQNVPNLMMPASSAILLKLAPNGTFVNSFSSGIESEEGSGLAITPAGSVVYVTTFKNTNVSIGGSILINPEDGSASGAIIKFNSNLDVIWAKAFGSNGDDDFIHVDVDNLGSIYVAGVIQGATSMEFGPTSINSPAPVLGVIAKFGFQGNKLGAITTTSSNNAGLSAFTDIDIVNYNEMYVTCLFDSAETFLGQTSVGNPANFSGFLAKIDSSGNATWMYEASNGDSIYFLTVEHDQAGNIYFGGWYTGPGISFGGGTSITNGGSEHHDVFFTKISDQCNLSLSISTTGATCGANNGSASVAVNGGSSAYSYQWTSGDSTQTTGPLSAGIYQVNIVDVDYGCQISGVAMISDIGGAQINLVGAGSNQITCPGGNDGQILINLVGGQAPLSVNWSTGDTTLLINNLTAGPYEVTVEDGIGCLTTQSLIITDPEPFELSYTSTNANCGFSDGTADVTALGATPGYTYLWTTGGTDNTETGIGVGDYGVYITDDNGCIDSILVMINEADGPVITIDSAITASCLDGNGGSIFISISGQPGPYDYQWSNGGGITQNLVNAEPGIYAVMVTAGNGCSSMLSGEILKQLPSVQPLCLVTVDSTGYNLVVWEKEVVAYLSHYNIYQEQTQAGVFNLVGTVDYDDLSQFVDSLANPNIRSYRYKISAVDTCGIESELSWEHKTIHLVKSSFGGNNFLSWDNYEGFTYPSFIIYRHTDQLGWVTIDTLPSSINSYTDIAPIGTNIDYIIEAVPSEPCTSTKAQDHNTTRSNRQIAAPNANDIVEPNNNSISLYPNPTHDIFTINLSSVKTTPWSVEVYDVSGKTLSYTRNLRTINHVINLSNVENGIYLVRVQVGNDMMFQKIVKQ